MYACRAGHINVVKFLLEKGSDASSYLSGHSSLDAAIMANSPAMIRLLLQHGAMIEDRGVGGRPAMISAAANGSVESLQELLDCGADPNATDLLGNTALHLAASEIKEKSSRVINLLLCRGADKNIPNLAGVTANTLALRSLNMEIIEAMGARNNKLS